MEAFANLLPFLVVLLAFYLLVIRPARNRQRDQQRLHESLALGQKVMTTSGLVATIAAIENNEVLLEAAPGVVLRFAKAAVGRVVIPTDEPEPTASADAPVVPD